LTHKFIKNVLITLNVKWCNQLNIIEIIYNTVKFVNISKLQYNIN